MATFLMYASFALFATITVLLAKQMTFEYKLMLQGLNYSTVWEQEELETFSHIGITLDEIKAFVDEGWWYAFITWCKLTAGACAVMILFLMCRLAVSR